MLYQWRDFIRVRLGLGLVLEETVSGIKQQEQNPMSYPLTITSGKHSNAFLFTKLSPLSSL